MFFRVQEKQCYREPHENYHFTLLTINTILLQPTNSSFPQNLSEQLRYFSLPLTYRAGWGLWNSQSVPSASFPTSLSTNMLCTQNLCKFKNKLPPSITTCNLSSHPSSRWFSWAQNNEIPAHPLESYWVRRIWLRETTITFKANFHYTCTSK